MIALVVMACLVIICPCVAFTIFVLSLCKAAGDADARKGWK